jgi:hypothetical protein
MSPYRLGIDAVAADGDSWDTPQEYAAKRGVGTLERTLNLGGGEMLECAGFQRFHYTRRC